MRLRSVVASVVAPLLVGGLTVAGGAWAGRDDTRSALAAALDTLPRDTQVASFTDWDQIRRDLGVGSAANTEGRSALADGAALADLSTRSVAGQAIEEMHDAYGWSAADLDWEVYGQAADGAVLVGRLDRSVSFAAVRRHLADLGYVRAGQVWSIAGGDGPIADLATTLAAVVLVPDRRLVVAAERSAYAMTVLEAVERSRRSLLSVRSVADIADRLVGSDSALLQVGGFSCASSAMPDNADVRAQAQVAIDRVGGLVAPAAAGRALDIGSGATMHFALTFASPSVAADQLRVRSALASGPFIGRAGRVEDSLNLAHTTLSGSTAALGFELDQDKGAFMTDGPLLFDACPP